MTMTETSAKSPAAISYIYFLKAIGIQGALLDTVKFNHKSTTASQRRDLRLQIMHSLELAGTRVRNEKGEIPNSVRKILRRKVSEVRKTLLATEAERKRQEVASEEQRAHAVARQRLRSEADRIEQKIYGGYSSTDNPQTRARDARFTTAQRRRDLQRKTGTELRDIVYEMTVLAKGTELREKDSELCMEMRQLYYGTPAIDSLFTVGVKNELIEAILKAETLLNGSD